MVHMGKRGFLMNGDQVIEPAKEVAKELNITDLKFSNGWIRNFKRRNNLKFKKAHGEKQSADFEGAEEWKKTVLPRVLEKIGYNFNLLYNADETGLCYRALPDQGYVIGRYAHLQAIQVLMLWVRIRNFAINHLVAHIAINIWWFETTWFSNKMKSHSAVHTVSKLNTYKFI